MMVRGLHCHFSSGWWFMHMINDGFLIIDLRRLTSSVGNTHRTGPLSVFSV